MVPSLGEAISETPPYFLSYPRRRGWCAATPVPPSVHRAFIRAHEKQLRRAGRARSPARRARWLTARERVRVVDVQVRLGDPSWTTLTARIAARREHHAVADHDDREALSRSLWLATNSGYGTALDNYLRVKTEAEVSAKEEDSSGDFSHRAAQISVAKPAPAVSIDKTAWEERVRGSRRSFANIRTCTRTS
jgi:hypothetical protein